MTMAPAQTRTSHRRVQAGAGVPMMVVIGYNSRELCDGQTLASPVDAPLCSAGTPTVCTERWPQPVTWTSHDLKDLKNSS